VKSRTKRNKIEWSWICADTR